MIRIIKQPNNKQVTCANCEVIVEYINCDIRTEAGASALDAYLDSNYSYEYLRCPCCDFKILVEKYEVKNVDEERKI